MPSSTEPHRSRFSTGTGSNAAASEHSSRPQRSRARTRDLAPMVKENTRLCAGAWAIGLWKLATSGRLLLDPAPAGRSWLNLNVTLNRPGAPRRLLHVLLCRRWSSGILRSAQRTWRAMSRWRRGCRSTMSTTASSWRPKRLKGSHNCSRYALDRAQARRCPTTPFPRPAAVVWTIALTV